MGYKSLNRDRKAPFGALLRRLRHSPRKRGSGSKALDPPDKPGDDEKWIQVKNEKTYDSQGE